MDKMSLWVQVFYKYEIIYDATVNEVPLLLIWGLSFTVRFIRLFLRKKKNASSGQSPIDTRLSPAANHQDVLGGVPLQTRSQCSSRAIKVYEKSWEKSLCDLLVLLLVHSSKLSENPKMEQKTFAARNERFLYEESYI